MIKMNKKYNRSLIKLSIIFNLLLYFATFVNGQILNDDCSFAKALPTADNYCSSDAEFTNVGAKPDPSFANGCVSLQWQNGVWFSFTPKEPAVLIRVFGSGEGGTMRSPKILLFEKCNKFVQCSPGKSVGLDELVVDNLNIGQTYFIMVESSVGGEGSFKLCVNDFIPIPSPESDCNKAVVLCDKSPFNIQSLTGIGNDKNELGLNSCIGEEFASSWYKWTCETSGPLTFTLTPNNHRGRNVISDDLDFAIYELPNGIDDCNGKFVVRCMASGANGDRFGNSLPLTQWIGCNGPTGLREGESDIVETAGCGGGDNNFISPLSMVAGKTYALIINNFSRSGLGFSIEFGGSGTFLGPKPDFEINANQKFECDKSITFTNKSNSATDPITSYKWNFGDRSIPNRQTGVGPYNVLYESFGDKTAALTVESSRGCTVTKIIDFYVEPCCKDTSTLDLDASIVDLICFEQNDGRILAQGIKGSPEYMYNLNGGIYQPNPQFNNLSAGDYTLSVFDIKGCRDTLIPVIINQPPPIVVDAGEDQTVDLGNTTRLFGSFDSSNGVKILNWSPEGDFDINGILNPEVFPKTTTTYTLTLVDNNGCTKEDQVTIRVDKTYKIFNPNIFSPNGDGTNDNFNVWSNNSVKFVELLDVYDRWGNLVYRGIDQRIPGGELIVGDGNSGWNGLFKGIYVVAGVYTWRAKVRFIDDEIVDFAGDLTLLR